MHDINREPAQLDTNSEHLASEIATLRLLLEVQEATALDQAARAERAAHELRMQAAQVAQQAHLIQQVVDASTDCVLVFDAHWNVTYLNSQARVELDSGNKIIGTNLLESFTGLLDDAFITRYRRVMATRQSEVFEDFHKPRNKWYAVNASPVGDGIGIFFTDITDRRRQEDALRKTEKLAAVGRLASSISHEINNPLESVVNLLYLIETASPESINDVKTYAALATNELARVSHIVTQTLKFHRQSMNATETRMVEILESVVSLFQGRVATRDVRLSRRYTQHDKVVCFAGDLRQVFANLIGNALDATADCGRIWLRTRLSCDWKTGRPGLRVLVADNGCGMSVATQKGLFEPFFTTKPATGTGLGLWVSEEIVRNHRGTIHVRSAEAIPLEARRPGCLHLNGTVFSIFFPVAD